MDIQERIETLTPRLIAYSKFVHSPELTQDDILQEMQLALLTRAAADPTFVDQNDSYMTWYATWQARKVASKTYTYDSHVQEAEDTQLEIILTGHDETMNDPAKIAEQDGELEELLDQIRTMTPDNQTVITMTYMGYQVNEIAERLHITPAAVSWRKKNIRQKLALNE